MEGILERPHPLGTRLAPLHSGARTPAITPMEGVLERPLSRRRPALPSPVPPFTATTPVITPDQIRMLRGLPASGPGGTAKHSTPSLPWTGAGTTPLTAVRAAGMEQRARRQAPPLSIAGLDGSLSPI